MKVIGEAPCRVDLAGGIDRLIMLARRVGALGVEILPVQVAARGVTIQKGHEI